MFNTKTPQEFVRITDDVAAIVNERRHRRHRPRVAMHITAGVFVNDWEDGLLQDFQGWLEQLAPAGLAYRHHQTGETQRGRPPEADDPGPSGHRADHGRKLDLGPWEQVFYAEFDGRRSGHREVMGFEGRPRKCAARSRTAVRRVDQSRTLTTSWPRIWRQPSSI